MSTAHTPGPWSAEYANCGSGMTIHAADGSIVGHTSISRDRTGAMMLEPSAKANAALMAAAPELLALAQHVADCFENTDAPLGIAAREAIAKAVSQ